MNDFKIFRRIKYEVLKALVLLINTYKGLVFLFKYVYIIRKYFKI